MNFARIRLPIIVLLLAIAATAGPDPVDGELQWQSMKKESMRLRLVALAWNHPRASFFASEEVFIAEKELTKDETRLVKLVYDFLPYQPRLSEHGLDYDTVHELRAVRDPECDEKLAELVSGEMGDWRQMQPQLKYSTDAPPIDLNRHHNPLPCYVTNAEDYSRPVHETEGEPPSSE